MRGNVVGSWGNWGPHDETKQKNLDIRKRFHSVEETNDMNDDDAGMFLFYCFFFDEAYEFEV